MQAIEGLSEDITLVIMPHCLTTLKKLYSDCGTGRQWHQAHWQLSRHCESHYPSGV